MLLLFVSGTFSCQEEPPVETLAYLSAFEKGTFEDIEGGSLFSFHSINLLGTFNNSGFALNLDDLPRHDFLTVSFDLYLHDSWDGNTSAPNGPDIWYMKVDGEKVTEVSFSNSPCASTYCLYQSFPEDFPSFNDPRTGSSAFLPGLCHFSDLPDGTAVYQITKTIAHNDSKSSITFGDKLVQSNSYNPACDESWSIGWIEVKSISLR